MSVDPRLEQMLADRERGARWIALVCSAVGLLFCFKYSAGGWPAILLSFVAAFVLYMIANAVHSFYLHVKYYGRDVEETPENAELLEKIRNDELLRAPDSMKVHAKPEKRLAVWMDTDIFDWIEFIGNDGIIRRYEYITVVPERMRRKFFELPDNQILIEPGIIYQLQVPKA